MPRANLIQNAVNAGEFSSRMEGRTDVDKFKMACKRLENMVLHPHGGATMRPGTRFIAEVKDSDDITKLIPFVFSNVQAYMLEFGDLYIRFYMEGGAIADPGNASIPYEIVSPYSSADLKTLQYIQDADILYITCPSHPVYKLTRLDHDDWTIGAVDFKDGPYLPENIDGVTNLSVNATTGTGVTLSATHKFKYVNGSTWNDELGTPAAFLTSARPFCHFLFQSPAVAIVINYVKITCTTGAGSSDDATAYIYATTGTGTSRKATGSPLATSTAADMNASGEKTFTFASPYTPTASTWYCIVFGIATADNDILVDVVSQNNDFTSGYSATATGTVTALSALDWKIYIDMVPSGTVAVSPFNALHVGSLWRMRHTGQTVKKACNSPGDMTTAKKFKGHFYCDLTPYIDADFPTWIGRIALEKSYDQLVWYEVAAFHYSTKQEFFEIDPDVYYRGRCTDHSTGTATITLSQTERWGTLKVTAYSSATSVTVDVISDVGSTDATPFWREGSWSAYRGYPTAVMFDGDRLVFGGSDHEPYTIWGSWVGDYEEHTPSDTDDAAYVFTLSKLSNRIMWLMSDESPVVGTLGEEARLIVAKSAPLSQTNPPEVKVQSNKGSAQYVLPINIGPSMVFVDRSRRKLLELTYDIQTNKLIPADLSLFAEHITAGGIVSMAYQQNPDSIIWCTLTGGRLVGLTYYRPENVIGWHKHPSDGIVESIACIPSSLGVAEGHDQLWMIVRRIIGTESKRYIELMADNETYLSAYSWYYELLEDDYRIEDPTEQAAAVAYDKSVMQGQQKLLYYLDCGLTYNSTAATSITGLSHLEGATVSIVADGVVVDDQVVSSGAITLEDAASIVHVGLPYTALLKTMRIEGGASDGTAQGRMKKISEVKIRFLNSQGGKYYSIPTDVREIPVLSGDETSMDTISDLKTDDEIITWSGDWEREGRITIMQDQPLPMTVLAIMQTVDTN